MKILECSLESQHLTTSHKFSCSQILNSLRNLSLRISTTYSIVVRFQISSHLMRKLPSVMKLVTELEKPNRVIIEIKFMLTLYKSAERISTLLLHSLQSVINLEIDADSSQVLLTAAPSIGITHGLLRLCTLLHRDNCLLMRLSLELLNILMCSANAV